MIVIPKHHNGPPDSGHGGAASGRFAEQLSAHRARVRLLAPIPLDVPLIPRKPVSDVVEIVDTDRSVARVQQLNGDLADVAPFDMLPDALVSAAESRFLRGEGRDHPYPSCFGCGPRRAPGDGLHLAPGPVPGHDVSATRWIPDVAGEVPAWLVWAAIDCPSGGPVLAAVGDDDLIVTGELAVEIRRPLHGGDRYQIISRLVARHGRKITTEAAIVDSNGCNRVVASSTWFVIDRAVDS